MDRRAAVLLIPLAVLSLAGLRAFQMPFREYPAMEYNTFPLPEDFREKSEFVFARLMFPPDPYTQFGRVGGRRDWREGYTSWTNDYPRSDRHMALLVRRLTRIHMRSAEQPVSLDDGDDVFHWPMLYSAMAGSMSLTDSQAAKLREYLLRGGFLVCDDIWGTDDWRNFESNLERVLPGRPIVELQNSDEVFHTLYDLDDRGPIPGAWYIRSGVPYLADGTVPHWRGIFGDKNRLMVAVWFNLDTGDSWEWADDPRYPEKYSALGIRMAVNHILYAMTH
jgi:hypothetical protein